MFKRLELLEGFRDKVFKIRMGLGGGGVRVGDVISLWHSLDWLMVR